VRDINRIPEILKELERVWKDNPDFRLGQLITVISKPEKPHPDTFYIEDDLLLENLKSFRENSSINDISEPLWKKYFEIGKADPVSLSIHQLRNLVLELKDRNEKVILTPESILEIINAPVSDKSWMNNQKTRLIKLKEILAELEAEGILNPIQVGYEIKTVPNTK